MLLSEFLTIDQFAKTFGVTREAVWRWRDAYNLPVIRLGRLTLIHEPSAAAWLKSRERASNSPESERNGVQFTPSAV
jgi:hypothetical protein